MLVISCQGGDFLKLSGFSRFFSQAAGGKQPTQPLFLNAALIKKRLNHLLFLVGDRRSGKNQGAAFEDSDRMLDMGAALPVAGEDRPAVVPLADTFRSGVDHRLDRDAQPRADREITVTQKTAVDVVRHLRIFVHVAADPMTDKDLDD